MQVCCLVFHIYHLSRAGEADVDTLTLVLLVMYNKQELDTFKK